MGYIFNDDNWKYKEKTAYQLNNRAGGTILGWFTGDMKKGYQFGESLDALYTQDPYPEYKQKEYSHLETFDPNNSKFSGKMEGNTTYFKTKKDEGQDIMFGQTADEMISNSDKTNAIFGFSGGKGSFGGSGSSGGGGTDMSSIMGMIGGGSSSGTGQSATETTGSSDMMGMIGGGSGSSSGGGMGGIDLGQMTGMLNSYGGDKALNDPNLPNYNPNIPTAKQSLAYKNEQELSNANYGYEQKNQQKSYDSIMQQLSSISNSRQPKSNNNDMVFSSDNTKRSKYKIINGQMYSVSDEGSVPITV